MQKETKDQQQNFPKILQKEQQKFQFVPNGFGLN